MIELMRTVLNKIQYYRRGGPLGAESASQACEGEEVILQFGD